MIVATTPRGKPMARLSPASVAKRHRREWIADAVAFLRVLDWSHLAGKRLAIIDFEDVPDAPPQSCFAFTTPGGLFELLCPYMTASRLEPGPAMMIGTAKIAGVFLTAKEIRRYGEAAAVRMMRPVVNAVAMHEYAHAIDFEAHGITLPANTTLDRLLALKTSPAQSRRCHSPGWVRAFAHLIYRSTALPCHHEHYLDRFRDDVRLAGYGHADDYLDALHTDFLTHGTDRPLVEVIRTPAPAGFYQLIDERDAARSAHEDS